MGSGCVADDTYVLDIGSYDYLEGIVLTFTDGSWTSSPVASLLPRRRDGYLHLPVPPIVSDVVGLHHRRRLRHGAVR